MNPLDMPPVILLKPGSMSYSVWILQTPFLISVGEYHLISHGVVLFFSYFITCLASLVLFRLPHPAECRLYYVNRDTLFSYHKESEVFLQV
jgi:hypothetical protein